MVMPVNDTTVVQSANGIWTFRAAAACPQNVWQNIFTVATGNVLLLYLIGERTVIQAGGASNLDLQVDPTAGAAVALSAVMNCAADPVGQLYSASMNAGDATFEGLAIPAGGAGGLLATGDNTRGWIVPPGTIEWRESAAAGTGSVQWYACWLPIDYGATLVAAA